MKKNIFNYIISITLLLLLLTPVCSCRLIEEITSPIERYGDFNYRDFGSYIVISSYHGTATEVTVPDYIKGKPVTELHPFAFQYRTTITTITLPNTLGVIGWESFRGCTALTGIELPPNLRTIGDSSFYGCKNITSIVIPGSVKKIATSAFADCTGLASITMSDSIETIGTQAFSNCTSLESIIIPASVSSIDFRAFAGCTTLHTIYCRSKETPSGWSNRWKEDCDAVVVWDYQG